MDSSDTTETASIDKSIEEVKWNCKYCTFANESMHDQCIICSKGKKPLTSDKIASASTLIINKLNDIERTIDNRFGVISIQINDQLKTVIHESGNNNKSRELEEILTQQMTVLSNKMDTVCDNVASINPAPITNEHAAIKQWLTETVKLPQYYRNFIDNAFLTLDTVCDVDKEDLLNIGIRLIGHQKEILRHAKEFKLQKNAIKNEKNPKQSPWRISQTESKYKRCISEIIRCFQPPSPLMALQQYHDKCQQLKEYIEIQYDSEEITHVEINKDKQYEKAIDQYLEVNSKEDSDDEILLMRVNVYAKRFKQLSVIEVYQIESHPRIPALNGQNGLKAKSDIRKGTILGEYFTVFALASDLEKLQGTHVYNKINEYGFNANVDVKISQEQAKYFLLTPKQEHKPKQEDDAFGFEMPPRKRQKLNYHNHNHNEIKDDDGDMFERTLKLVLDGYSSTKKSILLNMNDYRTDLAIDHPEEREKYMNVRFVTVYVRGWPRIFAVAIKDIKAGEELLTYYGEYHETMQQAKQLKERDDKLRKALSMVDMSDIVDNLK